MSRIESTFKARDVEEVIDIYFYRPLGYQVARVCRAFRIRPNTVTIASIVIGVAAGHLFYYRDVTANAWGIVLWIVADILDSSDGQLARMTNHKSRIGRILDGFGGNLIFISIYLHLLARIIESGYSAWWFFLVLAGGISHSLQSSLADYYRNAYMKIVVDPTRAEFDTSLEIRKEYHAASFRREPLKTFFLRVYLNYTVQQEALSRRFQFLRERIQERWGNAIPSWFREEYQRVNKPLMKYYAILTTNTRMIILSVMVLIDQPLLYFVSEVVFINAVMFAVISIQERACGRLLLIVDGGNGAG